MGYQLNGAFKAEKDEVKRFGYLYGIMWQSLDERDHIRTYNAPGITYSADELRDAFVAGVAEGWEKAKEVEIHNAIKLWVASSAVESGLGVWAAAHEVITAIYCKSENTQLRYQLDWPTPFPYTGLVGLYLSNQQ